MNKLKQLQLKLTTSRLSLGVAVLALVGISGYTAIAYSNYGNSQPSTVIENAGSVTVNQAQTPTEPIMAEPNLGALPSGDHLPARLCQNDDCTESIVQTNISGSSTIFSFKNPFYKATSTPADAVISEVVNGFGYTGSTSTIEMLRIEVTTAATTTYSVMCATAPTPYATSSQSLAIIETGTTVTGTPYLESGLYSTPNGRDGGLFPYTWFPNATTTFSKALLTPIQPYVICKVNPAANNAFVGNPTFVAKALLRVSKIRP